MNICCMQLVYALGKNFICLYRHQLKARMNPSHYTTLMLPCICTGSEQRLHLWTVFSRTRTEFHTLVLLTYCMD